MAEVPLFLFYYKSNLKLKTRLLRKNTIDCVDDHHGLLTGSLWAVPMVWCAPNPSSCTLALASTASLFLKQCCCHAAAIAPTLQALLNLLDWLRCGQTSLILPDLPVFSGQGWEDNGADPAQIAHETVGTGATA